MPIADDMANAGLIHGGTVLVSTIHLVQTEPMSLCVKAGMVKLPEFAETFELERDVAIDFSGYPDATYPVSVVIDLVLDEGKLKVLVDRVVMDGPAAPGVQGGRMFETRQHLDFLHFPHPTDPQGQGEYRYVKRAGASFQVLPEHEGRKHILRLVRPGWFIIPPGAKELPTISYLKVVQDLELVRRNRHGRRVAAANQWVSG